MLQAPVPTDYVIATGQVHSVRDLCRAAFGHVGLDYEDHVRVDPALHRPAEVDHLCGDASRATAELGWGPTVAFEDLIAGMVDADVVRRRERPVGAATSA